MMTGLKKDCLRTLRAFMDSRGRPWPKLKPRLSGGVFLVLAPHFDDEAIGCGGTILKQVKSGNTVAVAYLTDGGGGDPEGFHRDIRSVRLKEAREACGILGVSDVRYLNQPDGRLKPTRKARGLLEDVILDLKPDSILLPWLLDDDRDHQAANLLLRDAASGIRSDFRVYSYEVWTALTPNVVVDVSDVIREKKRALEAYASQLRYRDFVNTTLGLNQYRSVYNLGGRGFAEAFFESSRKEFMGLLSR